MLENLDRCLIFYINDVCPPNHYTVIPPLVISVSILSTVTFSLIYKVVVVAFLLPNMTQLNNSFSKFIQSHQIGLAGWSHS